jgi:hypothetical protein
LPPSGDFDAITPKALSNEDSNSSLVSPFSQETRNKANSKINSFFIIYVFYKIYV